MALARLKSVAGITIPDTALCNAAVDLLESSSPGFLCTYCLRTYIFGSPVAGPTHEKALPVGRYLIGFPQAELGLLPGAGGTQRLPRIIGTPVALIHILMGQPLNPREAERKGLVHETVSGKALDRAMEIARRLSSHTPESLAYIKRLVRNATETPVAQGLALERNLFLKLCISEPALARMRSYEEKKITSPSRSIEV